VSLKCTQEKVLRLSLKVDELCFSLQLSCQPALQRYPLPLRTFAPAPHTDTHNGRLHRFPRGTRPRAARLRRRQAVRRAPRGPRACRRLGRANGWRGRPPCGKARDISYQCTPAPPPPRGPVPRYHPECLLIVSSVPVYPSASEARYWPDCLLE